MGPEFIVYGSPKCQWCDRATGLLSSLGHSYTYVDVTQDADSMRMIKEGGATTVPQIWRENIHVGGYQDLVEHLENNV